MPAGGKKRQSEETETKESPSIGYRQAMEELEDILTSIERDEVDIDELSEKVERAADLVKLCRGKIVATEERVQAVVESFDHATPHPVPEEASQESDETRNESSD